MSNKVQITLWVTPAEREAIRALASQAHTNVSAYLRNLARDDAKARGMGYPQGLEDTRGKYERLPVPEPDYGAYPDLLGHNVIYVEDHEGNSVYGTVGHKFDSVEDAQWWLRFSGGSIAVMPAEEAIERGLGSQVNVIEAEPCEIIVHAD